MSALVVQEPHRSAMLGSFGPLYALTGLPFFFRRLRMEDHSAERVRVAATRGPIIYALHTRSHVDWLALNRVLVDRRLPLPVVTSDFDGTRWAPVGTLWRKLTGRLSDEPAALARTLDAGQPACVFLTRPWDLRDIFGGGPTHDPIPQLLAAQGRSERSFQVLPVVVVWNRRPEVTMTEVARFVLGTEASPGPLTKLWEIANTTGDTIVQVGEPVALDAYLARYADADDAQRSRILRTGLRRHLWQEARVVRGPRARPREQVARNVLASPQVTELVTKEAEATGRPQEQIRRKVLKTFQHVAADFSFDAVRVAAFVTRQIWNRIFSGVDVRPEDLDRIRTALREGTPILVPCHRSHLDYLLISSVLYDNDIIVPHIVAGENLSFWPLGAVFRRCGAFFIKRSFAGDRIFPVVFSRYLEELVRMEVPVEFFIEGGRSRTGKLLPPKVGVLAMTMDAAAGAREGRKVSYLPIYVGYEQIAEENVYARELGGAKKEKENVGQVVKATRVLFERYGKVYLRVGEPLPAESVATAEAWRATPKERREEVLMGFGERLLHRINTQAVALPTAIVALAVLAHSRRGVRHDELRARVERIRAFLADAGVQEGGGLNHVDGILLAALDRFVTSKALVAFEEAHGRVYSIVPEKRVNLEYYKNAVLHAFAPAAYYATAVRAMRQDEVDRDAVARYFLRQQFLLRYEFVLDPDVDEAELRLRAERNLVAYGALRREGERLVVADRGRIAELANLTANFLESYLLVLRVAQAQSPALKQLPQAALEYGKTLLACDEITRAEAINLQNLQNAAKAFREDGVLRAGNDGRAEVNPLVADQVHTDLRYLLGLDEADGQPGR